MRSQKDSREAWMLHQGHGLTRHSRTMDEAQCPRGASPSGSGAPRSAVTPPGGVMRLAVIN